MGSSWAQITVALIGYLGVLTGVVGNVVIQRTPKSSKDASVPRLKANKLRNFRAGTIALLLSGVTLLIILMCQPSEENGWFVRIHLTSISVVATSCIVILVCSAFPHSRMSKMFENHLDNEENSDKAVWLRGAFYFVVIIFAFGFAYLGWELGNWELMSPNEKLTIAAWDGLNNNSDRFAVSAADECIARFGKEADQIEQTLVNKPKPALGKVSDAERDAILLNGVLNDVATCYWIKGKVLTTRDEAAAKTAFIAAASYVYARAADQRGRFWSPAADASDMLLDMK